MKKISDLAKERAASLSHHPLLSGKRLSAMVLRPPFKKMTGDPDPKEGKHDRDEIDPPPVTTSRGNPPTTKVPEKPIFIDSTKELSIIHRNEILRKILRGENLEGLFHQLSAVQMKELRTFLEKEVRYLSAIKDKSPLALTLIKNNYEPVAEYYRKQDCHEPYESCIDESCYHANPVCFGIKMSLQIKVLLDMLRPYLGDHHH